MAIVGWILLSILGFLLFLLLLILFFPISYRIMGKKSSQTASNQVVIVKENKTESHQLESSVAGLKLPIEASAKVSWLFGLIRAMFDYPSPCKLIVKIGCFTILGKNKGKKKPSLQGASYDASSQEEESKETESHVKDDTEANPEDHPNVNPEINPEDNQKDDPDINPEDNHKKDPDTNPKADSDNDSNNNSDENSGVDVHETVSEKANDKSGNKNGSHKKTDIRQLKEKILKEYQFYHNLWLEKDTKPFLKDALKRILHILRNLMPRSIRGNLLFGAASPDVTGYLYGGYCVASTIFPKKLNLSFTPDFERQVLEGEVLIKGHFNVFTILLDGLRIFFDKRLKKIRRKLKNHMKK